jgi:hypothetical protein
LVQLAVSRPPGDQVLQVRHWFYKGEFGNQRVHPILPLSSATIARQPNDLERPLAET